MSLDEEMMNNSASSRILAVILLLFITGVFIVFQAGCESKKGSSGVVGFPQSFADLAEKVKPAVVNISTTTVRIPGSPFKRGSQTFYLSIETP